MKPLKTVQELQVQDTTAYFVNMLLKLGVDFAKLTPQKGDELVMQTAKAWLLFIDSCMQQTNIEQTKAAWEEFKQSNYNSKVSQKYPDLDIAIKVYTQKFIENLI
jgi:collagenase-like PrtC family protease